MYKEVAVPGSKGLGKAEFKQLFFKRDPGDRRHRDLRFEQELCGDMFRLLDKDGDGLVTLEDLLAKFVPKQQLARMPKDYSASVNRSVHRVAAVNADPRATPPAAPPELEEEIRDVYKLWLTLAQGMENGRGKLNHEAIVKILAGRKHAEMTWMDAREAADHIFASLPSKEDSICFADFANHIQVNAPLRVRSHLAPRGR